MAIKFDDRIVSNVADGILTEDNQILHTGESLLLSSQDNYKIISVSNPDGFTILTNTHYLSKKEIQKVSDVPIAIGTLLKDLIYNYNINTKNIIDFATNVVNKKIDIHNLPILKLATDKYLNVTREGYDITIESFIDALNSLIPFQTVVINQDIDFEKLDDNVYGKNGFYYSNRDAYKNIRKIPAKSLICLSTFFEDVLGVTTVNISSKLSDYFTILAMPYTPDQDATDLSGINAKLASLEESNTKLTSKITLLEGTNSTLNEKVTNLEGANSTLNGKVTTLESANSDLSGKVTTLQSNNTALSGKITTLEQDNTLLKSENSTLKNQVHTLQHKLSLTTTVEL